MGSSSGGNSQSVMATAAVVIGSTFALYRYYNICKKRSRLGNFPYSSPSFLPSIDLLLAIRAGALEKFVQNRKEALSNDCFYIRMPGMTNDTLVVTNPKDQQEIMRKEGKLNLFVSIGNTLDHTHGPGSMQAISGKQHNFIRKIFASLLSPMAIKAFIPHLFDAFTQMWDDLEKQCLADNDKQVVIQDAICEAQFYLMSKILYGMTPDNTSRDIMMQMRDDFEAQLEGHFMPPFSSKYKKAKEASQRIHTILRERFLAVLEERRSLMQDSGEEKKDCEGVDPYLNIGNAMETVADVLLKEGKDSDPKTIDDIIDNLDLLLEASHGTTMTVTTNTMYYLSLPENINKLKDLRKEAKSFEEFPTYDNLRNDMPYAQGAIYESMRLAPIITAVSFAVKDDTAFTFKGQKMQGPLDFMMSFGNNFVDESYFKNAEKFLPERWVEGSKERVSKEAEASFTPFGMGRHICLGYKLAVIVMKSALFCFAKDERRVIEFDGKNTCKKAGLFPAYSISDGFRGRVVKV